MRNHESLTASDFIKFGLNFGPFDEAGKDKLLESRWKKKKATSIL